VSAFLYILKFFTYTRNAVVSKTNFNINIYIYKKAKVMLCLKKLTLISTRIITIRCEKVICLRVSHALSLKRLTKTMECTPKRLTKVIVAESETWKLKIQHEKERFN